MSDQNYPGAVEIDDFGPFDALISVMDWNGWVLPRFGREAAEQIVAENHRRFVEYSEQGMQDAIEDLEWDPKDPSTIIITSFASGEGESRRLTANEDGTWSIGAGEWTWQVVENDWPQRDETVAALRAEARFRDLARAVRLARVRFYTTESTDKQAWRQAARDMDETELAYRCALLDSGVPIGHMVPVTHDIYNASSATLPHTNLVVPTPYPQVTGIDYVDTANGVAYGAPVSWHGKPFGTISHEGNGGEIEFNPDRSQGYRAAMEAIEGFAAECAHPHAGKALAPEYVYKMLIDEYERAEMAADYPETGDTTLVRVVADIDYDYVTVNRSPARMRPYMRFGADDVLQPDSRAEYWTGKQWRKLHVLANEQNGRV